MHEERVMKSHVEADLEAGRLKAAQEKTRAAENSLQAIEREVKDIRLKVDATRTQLAGLESDLRARLDRIETLKLEEDHLLKELAARKSTIASTESVLAELREKTHQEEKRVSEFTHIGGQILSFGASLADLQSRQEETARSLREASERDFALQMKINSLQETSNREAARVEEIRQERLRVEKDFNTFNNTAQKQKASMQVIEAEQRKRLAEAERQLQGQLSQTEHLKQELAGLQDRRAEFSKYLGDTAKHIKAAFAAARDHDAVLFFDEADSLLSKRVSTGESCSTSINQNRNCLMQELDRFDGVVIVTTNLFKNYDPALLRRIQRHIKFRNPDASMRRELFALHLPNPARVQADYAVLAELSKGLSGGDILNVCVNAIHAGSTDADTSKWQVTQETMEREIKKVRKAKTEHAGEKGKSRRRIGFQPG